MIILSNKKTALTAVLYNINMFKKISYEKKWTLPLESE